MNKNSLFSIQYLVLFRVNVVIITIQKTVLIGFEILLFHRICERTIKLKKEVRIGTNESLLTTQLLMTKDEYNYKNKG